MGDVVEAIEPLYISIGCRLRDERLVAGWTQSEVAGWVGLSRASIANVETGRQRLMLHQLVTYADVMSVPLGELMSVALADDATRRLRDENIGLRRRVSQLERLLRQLADGAAECLGDKS